MTTMGETAAQVAALHERSGLERLASPMADWRTVAASVWRKGDVAKTMPAIGAHALLMCLSGDRRGRRESDAFGGAEDVRYRANALCFVPAGQAVTSCFEGVATDLHVLIAPDVMDEALAELWLGDPSRAAPEGFAHRHDARLQGLAWLLRQEIGAPTGATQLLADGVAMAIAALVASRARGLRARRRTSARGETRLRAAFELIADELAEPLSIDRLAAACGMGRFAFARAFRAETGQAPHQYVLARRIERAVAMLTGGDAPIAEVAYACGFSSQAHLTETLSRRLGETPGRLRARTRG